MKWVVLAIVACIVPYTWLTLHFRKEGRPFEPYEDMKSQANVERLLAHGYRRVPLPVERLDIPPAAQPGSPHIETIAGGYPPVLRDALAEPAPLPESHRAVLVPATVATGQPLPVVFTCLMPDDHHVVGGLELYLKNNLLFLVPVFESVGGLSTRTRESSARATIPAGVLKSGDYQTTLLGSAGSAAWTLQVH